MGALAALADIRPLAALADIGSLPALTDVGPVGRLAAELLALLGAGTLLAELLAGRAVAIGHAAAMAGVVLPAAGIVVAVAVEATLSMLTARLVLMFT